MVLMASQEVVRLDLGKGLGRDVAYNLCRHIGPGLPVTYTGHTQASSMVWSACRRVQIPAVLAVTADSRKRVGYISKGFPRGVLSLSQPPGQLCRGSLASLVLLLPLPLLAEYSLIFSLFAFFSLCPSIPVFCNFLIYQLKL